MSMTQRQAAEFACDRLIRRATQLRKRIKTLRPGVINYYIDDLVRDLENAGEDVNSYTTAFGDEKVVRPNPTTEE